MATVIPKYNRIVQDQPQQAFYMVSIAQGGFLDTTSNNAGRLSPCVAEDFATAPTTLDESRKISRGALRFKKMLEFLQVRSNVSVRNILTTYASDAGDQPITNLAFGLVFENGDYLPTTGTSVDGSTTTTKAMYIADKIGEALSESRTENVLVYDPTLSGGVMVRESSTTAVTAAAVSADSGVIRDAITVTEVSAFAPNTSGQLATDNSLTYSAE